MKTTTAILLGCLVIAAALVVAGNSIGHTIANNLGMAASSVPAAMEVYSRDDAPQAADYMYQWEAAQYCRIDDDAFAKLLEEGKLAGTYIEYQVEKSVVDEKAYEEKLREVPEGAPSPAPPVTTVSGVELIFVKSKLDEWMLAQIKP